jgi:hypothetical protein
MKIPKFKNVKEEREFWAAHDSTDYHDDFEVSKDVVFVRLLPPIKNGPTLAIEMDPPRSCMFLSLGGDRHRFRDPSWCWVDVVI